MSWREVAWAAGVIDGEGCFNLNRATRNRPRDIARLDVAQGSRTGTPEMLLRFQRIFGFGTVSQGYVRKDRPNATPIYFWTVASLPRVQAVLAMVWPWLGPIKGEQARRVLAAETPIAHPYRGSRSPVVERAQENGGG
jgi:hypothetical protein